MPEFIFLAHNMIKGTYIFYEDGQEVYRSSNIITRFGKRYFTNLLAGNIFSSQRDIAVGIGSSAATIDDTRLDFEWYRLPISSGSTDISTVNGTTTYSVIYKTTLPQNMAGKIAEVGIFPATRVGANDYDSRFISDFANNLVWEDDTGFNPEADYNTDSNTYAQIGDNVIKMIALLDDPTEYFNSESILNLSGYSGADTLSLSYYKYDANLASIKLRLYSSDSAYYETTITPVSGTGYKIQEGILFSTLLSNPINNPDASKISKIGIVITPTSGNPTAVGMDGIRINDEDTFDPEFGIISRSVLAQPITKIAGRQIDLEYKLDIGYGA